MTAKKNILVLWDLTPAQKQHLESCAPSAQFAYVPETKVSENDVANANAILGNLPLPLVKAAPQLEWLQLNSAGANGYCDPGVLRPETVLTNASGAYGLAISEHMIGMVLMLQKKLDRYYRNQQAHIWRDEGKVRGIWNSRTLVIGMGNIGTEFAKRMHALGSEVVGIRRTLRDKPDCYAEQYTMDSLEQELPKADIVALCLPGTDATTQVLNASRLAHLKSSAVLVNVGRGALLDHDALAQLLLDHKIGGAALDVAAPEPLPTDHPLWDAPNTLITPHISGGYHMKETFELILQIAAGNLRAYEAGEPLKHQVDREAGY